jgi:cellulose synthase/poly-beta-1,6-N-acetylglucosamine synthase-like glycosyltransferase
MKGAVLFAYFLVVGLLSLYGVRRLWFLWVYYWWGGRRGVSEVSDATAPAVAPAAQVSEAPTAGGQAGAELPYVTVQLPVYNEANVIERLLEHAVRIDWPADRLEIQVLDDSTDETSELAARLCASHAARGVNIRHIRRTDRVGFKAGALAGGLKEARGELLALFDADFVPTVDFLRRTVPSFRDPRVGFVQGRWSYLNRHASLLTEVQAILLDAHLCFEHTVRHATGCFVSFSGTVGVWRRAAIEDAGGWQHDTLIEDADLSYRAQLRGWKGLHLADVMVPGELPGDMNAFKLQQHRWAKGNAQVIRKLLPKLLRSQAPLHAKVEAFFHLTNNCNYPLIVLLGLLLVPAMALRSTVPVTQILMTDGLLFLFNFVSVLLYFGLAQREVAPAARPGLGLREVLAMMSLGIGLSLNQSQAVIEGLFGRDSTFRRTPKTGDEERGESRARRSYEVRRAAVTFAELSLAGYFLVAAVGAVALGRPSALPFLGFFLCGFGYLGVMSLFRPGGWPRRQQGPGSSPALPRSVERSGGPD